MHPTAKCSGLYSAVAVLGDCKTQGMFCAAMAWLTVRPTWHRLAVLQQGSMCHAAVSKNLLYVVQHGSLRWLGKPGMGVLVRPDAWLGRLRGCPPCRPYADTGDSRVAKCAVDLIPYKTDPV
jgi:hypothetical protein